MIEPAIGAQPVQPLDRRLLLLAEHDNVVVACANLQAGDVVRIDGEDVKLPADAPVTGSKALEIIAARG